MPEPLHETLVLLNLELFAFLDQNRLALFHFRPQLRFRYKSDTLSPQTRLKSCRSFLLAAQDSLDINPRDWQPENTLICLGQSEGQIHELIRRRQRKRIHNGRCQPSRLFSKLVVLFNDLNPSRSQTMPGKTAPAAGQR